MQTYQHNTVNIPYPSRWGIIGDIQGRPLVRGILTIDSITENIVYGTVNFRGTPIPIEGTWNESTKQISFDSPFASFAGQLLIFDEQAISVRHFILNGNFLMKPPSIQAGEIGTWLALTDTIRDEPPRYRDPIPTAAAFLLSNLLYGNPLEFR